MSDVDDERELKERMPTEGFVILGVNFWYTLLLDLNARQVSLTELKYHNCRVFKSHTPREFRILKEKK